MKTLQRIRTALKLFLSLIAIAAFVPMASAQATYTKANNTQDLNLDLSWGNGTSGQPNPGGVALWDSTVVGANTTSLNGTLSWDRIQITNPGGTVTINNNTLTLTASSGVGIDASTSNRSLVINSAITLGAAQTWSFNGSIIQGFTGTITNGGNTLTINNGNVALSGNLTGTGGLTKTGGSQIVINGASSYNGTTTINGGTVQIGNAATAGSINSASLVTGTSGTLRFWRTDNVTFANTISGGIVVDRYGTGTTTLTGDNSYTGTTQINNGAFSVSSLKNVGGGNSSLGAPTNSTTGTISLGQNLNGTPANNGVGKLIYTGTGDTTDRVLNLNGSSFGGTIDQSGTNLLKFTSAVTAPRAGSKTLTLQGSTTGTGEIAGAIVDNTSVGTTALDLAYVAGNSTIKLGSVDGVSVGATISGNGTSATITFIDTVTKTVTLSANTTGTGTLGQTMTVTGVVNPTALAKAGTGTWTVSGVNTYTGGTTVSAGTLLIATPATATNSGTGSGSVNVTAGTLGGTGILRPGSTNTITVASGAFLAPGDSTTGNGIGTLALNGGGTTGTLLTLNAGAKMSFQLDSALASDKLNFWNYAGATDFVLNANVIDITFLAGSTTGTYNLFNFYSGNGTTLTASGISSGLSVNFLNGGAGTLDYSTLGQINLVVTNVPEPVTWVLLAGAGTFLMVMRRRHRD